MSAQHLLAAGRVLADGKTFQDEAPGLGLFNWKPIFHIGSLGVTKPMLEIILVAIVVIGFFWWAFAKPKLVPRGAQNVGEMGYMFVRDQIARPMMGKDGDKWIGLLVSLFFFIWVGNLFSVIPFIQFPVNARIAFPAVLAILVWLVMIGMGIKHQGPIGYFKNFMFPPNVPWPIYFLLAPIELVSTIIVRPFTHAVRLFANMFAGHLLVALFCVVGYHFLFEKLTVLGWPVGVLGVILTIVMTVFELFVQAVQAYVFTLLAAFYINSGLHADH